MKANVGQADRAIRVVLGLILIAAGLYFDIWFWAVGIILLLTAVFKWCLLYRIFGVSTCENRSSTGKQS